MVLVAVFGILLDFRRPGLVPGKGTVGRGVWANSPILAPKFGRDIKAGDAPNIDVLSFKIP